MIEALSVEEKILILCGHYEGVDQRIIEHWNMEEVSIGDFVLTGGELPAMVVQLVQVEQFGSVAQRTEADPPEDLN